MHCGRGYPGIKILPGIDSPEGLLVSELEPLGYLTFASKKPRVRVKASVAAASL